MIAVDVQECHSWWQLLCPDDLCLNVPGDTGNGGQLGCYDGTPVLVSADMVLTTADLQFKLTMLLPFLLVDRFEQ